MRLSALISIISSWRGLALWPLAGASGIWFIYAANDLMRTNRANHNIQELVGKHDVEIEMSRAHPQEILARVDESVRRDHIDDAQAILSSTETRLPPGIRALALYNIANARTRLAAEHVRTGDIDGAAALINLAKSEYRLALKLDPTNWDIRYNLDIAMRVVRDLPQADNPEITSPDAPTKLWTELPGVPKGLP